MTMVVHLGGLRLLLPFPTQKEKTLGPLKWSQVCSDGLRSAQVVLGLLPYFHTKERNL